MSKEVEYMTPKKEADAEKLTKAIDSYKFGNISDSLETIGIVLDKDGTTPKSAEAPRIFALKDGKAVTLEEGNMKIGSPAFIEAALKGEIFAYPSGEKRPVQAQGRLSGATFSLDFSVPLEIGEMQKMELDPPTAPALVPAPKWYHQLFNFIPSNQRRIDDYNRSVRAHAEWEKQIEALGKELEERQKGVPEQYKAAQAAAQAIDEKFGALRDEKSMAADREMSEIIDRAYWKKEADILKGHVQKEDYGIDIMQNVYGSRPQVRREWLKSGAAGEMDNNGLYTEKSFDLLTSAEIDPAKVVIGGKGLTEREFATLAMFAATDADIGIAVQKSTVCDPAGAIQYFKQLGYNEKQAKQIIADSISNTYTQDVLHVEPRMYMYFDTAMNGGRARATEALKAYQKGEKGPLAEIMGLAVKTAGSRAGITGDTGVHPLGKVAGEMLSLMERDPELKAMAKASFEQEEKEFCAGTPFQSRSFEEMTDSIQKMQKFSEVREKGLKALADLAQARAEGRELTAEEKKGYLRDILTARLAEGMRENQLKEIKRAKTVKEKLREQKEAEQDPAKAKELEKEADPWAGPMDYRRLDAYCDKLGEELEKINDEINTLAVSTGAGSSLPSSGPILLSTAMECRVVKKPAILDTVADPEKLSEITRTAEKIIETDHLDEKSMDFLVKNVVSEKSDTPYNMSKVMEAAVKVQGIDKKLGQEKNKTAELTGPKKENNKRIENEELQAVAPAP